MARFKYAAVTPDGQQVVGVVKGSSVDGVTTSLEKQGLDVRVVTEEKRSLLQLELTPKKIKLVELGNFSRQMAAFISAGVPMLDALMIIESEATDKTLKKVVREVADSLRFGESFSNAMASHTDAFPAFYIAVLSSAEATGELDVVLQQLSRYIDRDMEAKRKIRSALAYPGLVMIMAMVTVAVLTFFVLPRFKEFFESFNAELPFATRLLLRFTGFIGNWWPVIAAAVLGLVVLFLVGVRTGKGKEWRDAMLLATPVLGDVVRFTVIERFCRVLSSMVQAGVPIPDSLHLASTGANNRIYEKSLVEARAQMLEGEGIARPIQRTGLFPGTVTQMMRVGEETGTLDDQLEAVATYYERELEYKLKRLTNLFEPIAILMVGVIVGFVAIALVSAIYGIYNQVELE